MTTATTPKLNLTQLTALAKTANPHERAALAEQARALAKPRQSTPAPRPVPSRAVNAAGVPVDVHERIYGPRSKPAAPAPEPPPPAPPTMTIAIPVMEEALSAEIVRGAEEITAGRDHFPNSDAVLRALEILDAAPASDDNAAKIVAMAGGEMALASTQASRIAAVLHVQRHGTDLACARPLSVQEADYGLQVSLWRHRRLTPPVPQEEPRIQLMVSGEHGRVWFRTPEPSADANPAAPGAPPTGSPVADGNGPPPRSNLATDSTADADDARKLADLLAQGTGTPWTVRSLSRRLKWSAERVRSVVTAYPGIFAVPETKPAGAQGGRPAHVVSLAAHNL